MKRYGFTLVEILLIVIILGILTAIVVPQFSMASEEQKTSYLINEMQNVRMQIGLYKSQHNSALPTAGGLSFIDAMTKYTYADGTLANPQSQGPGVFGPYLQQLPKNPFIIDNATAAKITTGTELPNGNGSSGWYFNTSSGEFNANDNKTHSAF